MKKHTIAVALVCVVFFTVAWGAVAEGQTLELVVPPPYEWEPWHNVYEPPSFYLGPGELVVPPPYEWEPWHNVYEPPSFYLGPGELVVPPPYEWEPGHNVRQPPSNGAGAAVPEPGSLALLIGGGLAVLVWAWRRRRGR